MAAAGDLDPSFDGDGKVVLEQAGWASAIAMHPDGGLVVVGASSDGVFIVRLKSDGNLDSSFGSGDDQHTSRWWVRRSARRGRPSRWQDRCRRHLCV